MAQILPDLSQMTREQLLAQIEALRAAEKSRIYFKITERGGVSLYGLQQFPVTLYATQWQRLLDAAPQLREFMMINASKLSEKPKRKPNTLDDVITSLL
ncbi:MAG: hypothetical protein ACREQ5_04460 [Candidatus Dormibacteria bacterium]